MKQYIDKDALVAEIEKRLNYRNKGLEAINNGTFWDEEQSEDTFNEALTTCAYNAVKNELFELKCFLDIVDTLEVKEVDLEKEIEEVKHNYKVDDNLHTSICSADIEWLANHFFELGLKAQKGE
jgi:hypothetical protein